MSNSDLSAERLREVLHYEPETGVFTWKLSRTCLAKVGTVAGSVCSSSGYRRIKIGSKPYKAHRLAWLYVHGVWPPEDIDHINRVRDDNRIANLRPASRAENTQNASLSKLNLSGHKGVCWRKKGQVWHAQITHCRRVIHLGYFHDIDDAVAARKAAEAALHPFAVK